MNERSPTPVEPLVLQTSDPGPLPPACCNPAHDLIGAQCRTGATVWGPDQPSDTSTQTPNRLSLRVEALLQLVSSARLGQSWTPSHSGLTLVTQEVEVHWKFPLQLDASRSDGDTKQL